MKTQNRRLVAIVAASLLLGSAGVMAFGGGHGFDGTRCDHGGASVRMLDRLDNVTDEQRAQLDKLFDEQRGTMRERRDAMRASRRAISDAMRNGAAADEIRTLADKQGELVAAMIVTRAGMRQKMAAILTPEQMKQLQDFRAERMGQRRDW